MGRSNYPLKCTQVHGEFLFSYKKDSILVVNARIRAFYVHEGCAPRYVNCRNIELIELTKNPHASVDGLCFCLSAEACMAGREKENIYTALLKPRDKLSGHPVISDKLRTEMPFLTD